MIKLFLLLLFTAFCVGGVCDFLHILKMKMLKPQPLSKNYSVIVLDGECALNQLVFQWQKIVWYGNEFSFGIIAITDNLTDNQLDCCKKFSANKNIVLTDYGNLYRFVLELEHND